MSSTQTLQDGTGVFLRNDVGNAMMFICSAIPSTTSQPDNAPGDSVAGFGVGCMAIRSDNASVDAMVYFNTGTTASCTWTALKIDAG